MDVAECYIVPRQELAGRQVHDAQVHPAWMKPLGQSHWHQQIDFFKDRYRVIAYDSINHAHSGNSPRGEPEPDRVDQLEAALATFGIERPILCGPFDAWLDGRALGVQASIVRTGAGGFWVRRRSVWFRCATGD